MADTTTVTVNMRVISDISDAKSNVESLQKSFSKLKLPDKLGEGLNKKIVAFYKEYEKYQKKLGEGIKTQGDVSQLEKSLNVMRSLYQEIGKDASKVTKLKINDLFDMNSGDFKRISDQIAKTVKDINNVKIDSSKIKKPLDDIRNLTKNSRISGKEGLLNNIIGHVNTGEIDKAKQSFKELEAYAKRVKPVLDESGKQIAKPGTMSIDKYKQLEAALNTVRTAFAKADAEADPFITTLNDLEKELKDTKAAANKDILGNADKFNKAGKNIDSVTESLKRMHKEEFGFNRQVQDIDRQIQSYFGLTQMIRKVGQIAKDAFKTVKELDAAMTETAVVTNFSVSDMWDMLPTYTEQANKLGSTIKDVYEAATLYYQQGLNQNQAMGLASETLKMARIGGLQAAEATDMMTAALRGFNMEINQTSAQKINDVYSQLAAITASNTKEIGSAMERTASIANSANMDFSTTSAFLAQMIETTREAPENLGTAMKTIIARFQEMKKDPTKLVDSEGVAMDVNKVDAALKTIGVALTNTKGEFRDLDDVFLDISARWDSLTQGQQRYIATIAAGSRQQSRFIAMMSNYNRTMELVDAANNSAGASQKQFEKTLESMSTKLNKLKNAWDQFTMGLMNNEILKGGVDVLTKAFTAINKIINALGSIPPSPFEGITKSALTLVSTLAMLNFGKKAAMGGVMAGVGWIRNEGKFIDNFKSGYGSSVFRKSTSQESQGQLAQQIQPQIKNIDEVYQEQINKRLTAKAQKFMFPVVTEAYAEKIDTSQLDPRIKAAVEAELDDGPITEEKRVKINAIIDKDIKGSKDLHITEEMAQKMAKEGKGIEQFGNKFSALGTKISSTGMILQQFGSHMNNSLGRALMVVGSMLTTLGTSLDAITVSLKANLAAELADVRGTTADAVAKEGLSLANIKAAITSKALGRALWGSLGPYVAIVAAVLAVVAVYKILDAAIETNKEKMERMTDAAAKASEAYSSAKQQTSELTDAIEQIKTNDNAFDNLVAGTAEFNQQLIEANNKITELINKYPMLTDYLTTDSNGLMHISEEGFKAVQEEQKRRQSNAAALNSIQNAQLKREQNEQKADKLRNRPWNDTPEDYEKRLQQAKYLEDSAEAAEKVAQQTAISNALSGDEIQNREKISAIYADQYDELVKQVDTSKASIDDMRQAYADFYGYTYNKSTKTMTDVEGNEVMTKDDDQVVKDAYADITVLTNFEINGASLDSMLDTIDSKFKEGLGDSFTNSAISLSDILSKNIDIDQDSLKQLFNDPSQLEEGIRNLTTEQLAALSNVSEEEFNAHADEYIAKLEQRVRESGVALVEKQKQVYSDLGGLLAQAQYGSVERFNNDINANSTIIKQIESLKVSQAQTISTIGQQLNSNVGSEAMSEFVTQATDIYNQNNEKVVKEFDKTLEGVSWESASSRLEAYTKMTKSTSEEVRNLGDSMRHSADEANILGEAFTDFLGSDSWSDIQENLDNYTNGAGQFDGAGILKMAESSRDLKVMLDSGEVSAQALASALQGVQDGAYSFDVVNTSVLKLLTSMTGLANESLKAHNIIENFDAGIDTGEGDDFVKQNSEASKEYYDNGEYGNEQLQNYIKLAAGTDKWNKALQKNHGDLKKAEKSLMNYVSTFENGFEGAWKQMVNGEGINGKALSDNVDKAIKEGRVDEKLKEAYKKLSFSTDENGFLQLDNVGDLTTSELESYFQEIYGVSEEYAHLLMQDLANYDRTLSSTLQSNDLKKSVESGDLEDRRGKSGELIFTDAELKAFKAAGGSMEELAKAAGTTVDKLEDSRFDVLVGDERRDARKGTLLRDYAEIFQTGQHSIQSLFGVKNLQNEGGIFDLQKLITDTVSKGMNEEQALQSAYKAWKIAQKNGEEVEYNGQKMDLEETATYTQWKEEREALENGKQWVTVGETIGDKIVSALKEVFGLNDTNEGEKGSQINEPNTNAVGSFPEDAPITKFINWIKDNSKETPNSKYEGNNPISDTQNIQAEEMGKATEGASKAIKDAWDAFIGALTSHEVNPKTVEGKTHASTKNVGTAAAKGVEEGIEEGANTAKPSGRGKNAVKKKTKQEVERTVEEGTEKGATAATPKQTAPGMPSNAPQNQKAAKAAVQQQQQVETVSKITVDTSEAEAKIENIKGKLETIPKEKGTTVTVTQNYETSGKKDNTKSKTIKVKYKANKKIENEPEDLEKKVTYTAKIKNPLKDVKGLTAHYHPVVDGSIPTQYGTVRLSISEDSKKFKVVRGGAKGINNTISYSPLPAFGSLAKGTRYGRIGPKDKGGLTLTGEKGFEIAWLPSESKSMILGTDGPQMLNLPNDAVVYTHEQSKKILKQKSIPAGSHSDPTGRRLVDVGDNKTTTPKKEKKKSGKNGSKNGSNEDKGKIKNIKVTEEINKKSMKINTWWWNMTKKVEATQRKIDSLNKKIERLIKDGGNTLKGISKVSDGYIKNLKTQISLNETMKTKASNQLTRLDNKGKGTTKTQKADKNKVKNAEKRVLKAETQLERAKATKNKKDDKKAKKNLKAEKKRLQKAKEKLKADTKGINWTDISYDVTKTITDKKGKKTKKKVTKKSRVNLAPYIKLDEKTGAYVIDYNKINKNFKGTQRKAVKDAAQKKLEDLVSKRNTAEDNIEKAQEALRQLSEELYEDFLAWENELTIIWNLTQKIEAITAKIDRNKNYGELLENQFKTGQIDSKKYAIGFVKNFLTGIKQQTEKINLTRTELSQKTEDLNKFINQTKDKENLAYAYKQVNSKDTTASQKETYTTFIEKTERKVKAIDLAWKKYLDVTKNADGTLNIDFNTKEFEKDQLDTKLQTADAEIIQNYVKELVEQSKNVDDTIDQLTEESNEQYTTLQELKEQWVDSAEQLWKMQEEQQKEEIDQFKKLSDSITNALKNLLDQIKKKLDERRKAEDNAKTERDISQKQQRLAMLRADTAGGHAVEIAQLEKEIADAQQSYERSLEDQLLEKLQNQADEAANQREQMIALQEAILESVNNAALVDEWMKDPIKYEKEIKGAWLAEVAPDYEKAPQAMKENWDKQWEEFWIKLATNQPLQQKTEAEIGNTKEALDVIEEAQKSIENEADIYKDAADVIEDAFIDAENITENLENVTSEFEEAAEELRNTVQETPAVVNPEKYNPPSNTSGSTKSSGSSNGIPGSKNITKVSGGGSGAGANGSTSGSLNYQTLRKYQDSIISNGKFTLASFHKLEDLAAAAKVEKRDAIATVISKGKGDLTWFKLAKLLMSNNVTQKKLQYYGGYSKTAKERINAAIKDWNKHNTKKYNTFKTGGLANYTGPAWLDGTPSKPELVLNAADTRNFLALKDVLSRAINAVDSTTSVGNATYEININVDHLNSDYDVDKVAQRVKKIIVNDSSYRNVTQVRNFR